MLRELTYVPKSRDEIVELVRRAQDGDRRAADDVVKANYAFVLDTINKHFRPGGRVSHEELVLAGLEGLSVAINRFDTERGIAFMTYAAWWIKSYISRQQANFFTPLSIRTSTAVKEFNDVLHDRGPYDSRIRRICSATSCTVDAHGDAYDEDDMTWKVRPSVDGREAIDEMIDAEADRKRFEAVLGKVNLSKQQKNVLRRRYLETDGDVRSFAEIAKRMRVSWQRVEQLDHCAKQKLRRTARQLKLSGELQPD